MLGAPVFLVALVFLAGADVAGAGVAEAAPLFLFAGPGVAMDVAGLFLAMAGADGTDGGGGGATTPVVALVDEE